MKQIDLNCDLGEGAGFDAELMPLITSASIACGAHAGNIDTMRATVELAQKHAVAIGAHPGFEDREHFGRRELAVTPAEVGHLVKRQIERLRELTRLHHVKPHGALYHLTNRDAALAEAVAEAIHAIDPLLILFAPAAGELAKAGQARGLRVAREVFADRSYQSDGKLTPRSHPAALIQGEEAALAQVLLMVQQGRVRTVAGAEIPMTADTVCLHGDGPHAVAFARRLNRELKNHGIELKVFGS